MNDNLQLSEFGEQCIKLWEEDSLTPKLEAYDDGGGTWTISWGCTKGVYKGMKITAEEAEAMFQQEIAAHVALVKKYVKTPLAQCEFDAAVSFVFNEGVPKGWVNAINSKDYENQVPITLMKYVYVKKKRWAGLVKRRADELSLWHGVYEDARLTVPAPYGEISTDNDIAYADPAKRELSHKVTATVSAVAAVGVKSAVSGNVPLDPLDAAEKTVATGQRIHSVAQQGHDLASSALSLPHWPIIAGAVALAGGLYWLLCHYLPSKQGTPS
jgi:GH24 family phage-related lysozyme (muramidase)